MTVIFINRYFFPDHSATSQMLSEVAFGLADRDLAVKIIASRQLYDAANVALPALESVRGVEVHRVWTTRFGRTSLAGRAIDYVTFYISAALKLRRLARKGNVVVAKTDPPMLSVVAAPIARRRQAILVNWLQDVFPEVAQEAGLGDGVLRGAALRLLRWLRNRSLKQAAVNVALGERMSAHLAAIGVPAERIRLIGNFADGNEITPLPSHNRLRSQWQIDENAFVVGYSGNLGRAHEYQTMLAAMALTGPGIVWLFVGGGVLFAKLQQEATARRIGNVRFAPYQPEERLAESLSATDVHLVSLLPQMEGLIVPSKFYGICAAGRPSIFIGDRGGEIARLIGRHACGRVVDVGDGVALAQTLKDLAADRELCREMGAHARSAFDQEFDKSIAIARWQSLLRQVAGIEAITA